MHRVLLWALALALVGPCAHAQSLGELAAQEKARRERDKEKKATSAAKVYTDTDLQEGAPGQKPTPAPPPVPYEPPTTTGRTHSESEPAESDSPLRARLAETQAELEAVRQELSAAEAEVERLKQDLNPMSTTYNTDGYVLFRLQGQLKEAADKADALRPRVAEAQKAWEAAELAARRAGLLTQ